MNDSLREELTVLGCSSHSCVVAKPRGQGTNVPCHCLPRELPMSDRIRIRRVLQILRTLAGEE